MRDLRRDNFGILIAYLLPGSVALWGASYHVEAVRPWFQASPGDAPSIGGFLFATLASTSLGMVVSALRWALVDTVLSRLGVRPPRWNFELFAERLAAYEFLIAHHYRYYQFYANMLVALAIAYASRILAGVAWGRTEASIAAGFVTIEAVLCAGSWDTLTKYYARTDALLRAPAGRRDARVIQRGVKRSHQGKARMMEQCAVGESRGDQADDLRATRPPPSSGAETKESERGTIDTTPTTCRDRFREGVVETPPPPSSEETAP